MAAAKPYSLLAYVRLTARGAQVGRGLNVHGWLNLAIHPESRVVIGDQVRMNAGFARNGVGAFQRLGLQVLQGATLVIGDRVGISNALLVCGREIVIGDGTFIGGGCGIYDTDFHPIDAALRVNGDRSVRAQTRPIHIGRNCFIGGHTLILKGVTIGDGAVIGAGAVVTRDVPANEIWAGNPATCIRSLVKPA